MSEQVSYIITNSGTINIVIGGTKVYTISPEHLKYTQIVDVLKEEEPNTELLTRLCDISAVIKESIDKDDDSNGSCVIKNGLIYHNGFITDTTLTRRILKMVEQNYPFRPMLRFLENLMDNPSAHAIRELYEFLDHNSLPITADGCFLSYKRVRDDWFDYYTGTLDNSVGNLVSMPREDVCADSNVTCAAGLHFASLSYLPTYHGGRGHAIVIKINPRDVVSIPERYDQAKGRCCAYIVVAEHNPTGVSADADKVVADFESAPVCNTDGSLIDTSVFDEDDEYDDADDYDDEDLEGDDFDGVINQACTWVPLYRDATQTSSDESVDNIVNDPTYGIKPSGQRFWNNRNSSGKFTKRS